MSLIDTRGDQIFPVLDRRRRSRPRRASRAASRAVSSPASRLSRSASGCAGLARARRIDRGRAPGRARRRGRDHDPRAGQITGEISQLAGRTSLAAGRAGPEGCTALPFDSAHLRALMVGSAEIGELVMRAFILRRVGLIEEGGAGSVLVGRPGAPDVVRLQGFLARNGYPCAVLDVGRAEGHALVERLGIREDDSR